MLKYLNTQVTFAEIPDEITLCINITGCRIGCKGCHSSYLAQDIGIELTFNEIRKLIKKNSGISCIALMGGDSDPNQVNRLAINARMLTQNNPIKIAWYSGRQKLSEDIDLENFDFIKLGPYIKELGPLNNKTTNQRLYKVVNKKLIDITDRFWK